MYTPKFLKSSIQILHTSHKNYLVRKYTRNWSFRNHYHSQPHISPSHLISTSLFIILHLVRRQNVVIKSDILTMFKGFSFFLFVLETLNTIFSLKVLQFVARLFLFDVGRAEKQQLMPLWVSLK